MVIISKGIGLLLGLGLGLMLGLGLGWGFRLWILWYLKCGRYISFIRIFPIFDFGDDLGWFKL